MVDSKSASGPQRALSDERVTELLQAWEQGEEGAVDALFELLYEQLRTLAGRQAARQEAGETLRPTALVHETYLRLIRSNELSVDCREHFLSLAARAMRFVLVDYARKRAADKRGGGVSLLAVEDAHGVAGAEPTAVEVLTVDRALERLGALDERQARVFELRAFGGLTVEEVADVLDIGRATVKRDWQKAKMFVARTLMEGTDA